MQPLHAIMVLIALCLNHSLNVHAQLYNVTKMVWAFITSGTLFTKGQESVPFVDLSFNNCWFLVYMWSFVLFVCFVALRPKSTAMVIAGRSVHLTTLFPGQA